MAGKFHPMRAADAPNNFLPDVINTGTNQTPGRRSRGQRISLRVVMRQRSPGVIIISLEDSEVGLGIPPENGGDSIYFILFNLAPGPDLYLRIRACRVQVSGHPQYSSTRGSCGRRSRPFSESFFFEGDPQQACGACVPFRLPFSCSQSHHRECTTKVQARINGAGGLERQAIPSRDSFAI